MNWIAYRKAEIVEIDSTFTCWTAGHGFGFGSMDVGPGSQVLGPGGNTNRAVGRATSTKKFRGDSRFSFFDHENL